MDFGIWDCVYQFLAEALVDGWIGEDRVGLDYQCPSGRFRNRLDGFVLEMLRAEFLWWELGVKDVAEDCFL